MLKSSSPPAPSVPPVATGSPVFGLLFGWLCALALFACIGIALLFNNTLTLPGQAPVPLPQSAVATVHSLESSHIAASEKSQRLQIVIGQLRERLRDVVQACQKNAQSPPPPPIPTAPPVPAIPAPSALGSVEKPVSPLAKVQALEGCWSYKDVAHLTRRYEESQDVVLAALQVPHNTYAHAQPELSIVPAVASIQGAAGMDFSLVADAGGGGALGGGSGNIDYSDICFTAEGTGKVVRVNSKRKYTAKVYAEFNEIGQLTLAIDRTPFQRGSYMFATFAVCTPELSETSFLCDEVYEGGGRYRVKLERTSRRHPEKM